MPDNQLPFKLVTPTGVVFDGPVRQVTAVNPLGEFGVLPEHVNFITALEPGILTIRRLDDSEEFYVVSRGLAEVKEGELTVLAQTAERLQDMVYDQTLVDAVAAAEERLRDMSFYEPEYENARLALKLARARLMAAETARDRARG